MGCGAAASVDGGVIAGSGTTGRGSARDCGAMGSAASGATRSCLDVMRKVTTNPRAASATGAKRNASGRQSTLDTASLRNGRLTMPLAWTQGKKIS